MNNTDKIIFGVVAVFTIAIFGFIVSSSLKTDKINSNPEELIGSNPHIKGNADSKVILIEFSDFECPACKGFEPFVSTIISDYSEYVGVIYKHFPLPSHSRSVPAARASEAAALQGKFWEYHDELFANFPEYSDENLITYAENIGLDVEKFKSDLNSDAVIQKVNEDARQGQVLSIPGTPTFFLVVDGDIRKISINQYGDLEKIVREAIEETGQQPIVKSEAPESN